MKLARRDIGGAGENGAEEKKGKMTRSDTDEKSKLDKEK